MKVCELIAILQNMDGDMPVLLPGLDGAYWSLEHVVVEQRVLVPVKSGVCTHMPVEEIDNTDCVIGPPITGVTIS